MSYTNQNFLNILLEECQSIDEKCDGYKEYLQKTVIEIIEIEKQHSIQGTNINQKIIAICEKAANFLVEGQKENT